MEILWVNFRFWWTNELMHHYLLKNNFKKVEELLIVRRKLTEKLRNDLSIKKIKKENKILLLKDFPIKVDLIDKSKDNIK